MEMRLYQGEARAAVWEQWNAGIQKTLLIMATGTGKTIVFSKIIEDIVKAGGRALVLAHREELLNQAADKLHRSTGLCCAVEKAEESALDSWFNVTVGSVQTMQREKRRALFETDHYTHIIVDEAHHAVSPSYLEVLNHFPSAKVLGVTATADRGDKRNLGEFFDTVAYEYSLLRAIREGYLCKIVAHTIPLKIDLAGVAQSQGDYAASALGSALDPYLEQIAGHIQECAADRKTVVFLPLIATSQKFLGFLKARGINAREVNGESHDRTETLDWFHRAGPGAVLCNAMLLTEGWDQQDVSCICVLRATKIRALYTQMVGRGTRLHPSKNDLLLLDFLWHSEKHELCRPAHLVCENQDPEISKRVAEIMAEEAVHGQPDLMETLDAAEGVAVEERERSLVKKLEEQKHRKRALVDPLQFEMSVSPADHAYVPDPSDLRGMAPPSKAQLAALEKAGIFPDEVECQGHATRLLDMLQKRRTEGYSTPKQIRFLESRGFQNVGTWRKDDAGRMLDRIAGNFWQVPRGIIPKNYTPPAPSQLPAQEGF